MKKTIYIKGMHCASCEMLIKNGLQDKGIEIKNISSKKGTMDVEIQNEKIIKEIEKTIKELGYTTIDKPTTSAKDKNKKIINTIVAIIIVLVLAIIFKKLDIAQYLPSSNGKLSFGIAILTGVIASVSTCLAIVGSIVLGFGEYADTTKGSKGLFKTHLSFHLGRIGGFFVGGAILGLIGQSFALSLTMTSILTLIVGIIVLWMGLHVLKVLPSISSLGVHLPKRLTEKTLTTKNPTFAPIIGALTFFLPCGFTLSMQLVAISSGNPLQGGLIMALFALGTTPVLFALGLGSSYIKEKKFTLLHTIIGMLIVLFGIFMINNGQQLLSASRSSTNNQTKSTNNTGIYETINIGHDGYQTIPNIINLESGKNYELIINPSSDGRGCMVTMLIPGLDGTIKPIIKDQPIIYKFTNIKKGKYSIVCGTMGMRQGQIVVK